MLDIQAEETSLQLSWQDPPSQEAVSHRLAFVNRAQVERERTMEGHSK